MFVKFELINLCKVQHIGKCCGNTHFVYFQLIILQPETEFHHTFCF